MKPIYFPFTYISEPVAAALAACFKQTAVYQAMSQNIPEVMTKWAEKGVLEIRTPVKTDEQKLNNILMDYKNWASLHQDSKMAFFRTQKDKTPFFDEDSEAQIRAEIKKQKSGIVTHEKPDPLLNALIFLQMAQEFDIQTLEVVNNLEILEKMEHTLMKDLKDEEDSEIEIPAHYNIPPEDSGNYMTPERIASWLYLMSRDPEISGLFITNSRAVMSHLLDKAPDMKQICQYDAIPVYDSDNREKFIFWQDNLMKALDRLAEDDNSQEAVHFPEYKAQLCIPDISLQIHLAQGKTPNEFFRQILSTAMPEFENKGKQRNTLIGLIEFQGM